MPVRKTYRIISRRRPDGTVLHVHEVYYDGGKVNGWSGPVTPTGATLEELQRSLRQMIEAVHQPTLTEAAGTLLDAQLCESR